MARTLSRDIRLVGDTLGAVLRALGGDDLYAREEAMRLAAKRAREAADGAERDAARASLTETARSLSAPEALQVVRAFTLYFQLVNVAEDVHRTRELRRRELEGGPGSVAESLSAIVGELAESGATREEVLAALADLKIVHVLTAHPTEARRRTTERLLARVREVLETLDRRALVAVERAAEERHLRAAIEALWQHGSERRGRPDVLDEVRAGLWYIERVLFDVLPRVQRRLRAAIEAHYGPVDPASLPVPITFGSWMGGDRDGNPYVTDAVTERTLELHRRIALERYVGDVAALSDPLAAFSSRLPDHEGLRHALQRAEAAVPEVVLEIERRNPDEPLRRLLSFARERLRRSIRFEAGAYPSAQAFLDDLCVLRQVLRAASAEALAGDTLLDSIERVRCFGFGLAALDVREDSRVVARVLAELLQEPDFPEQSEADRVAALTRLNLPTQRTSLSPEAQRLLELFATVRRVTARFGAEAMGSFILSMTESHADVLGALALADRFGIASNLDLVPLFESSHALAVAGPLLEALFANPDYVRHLEARGRVQEVLLGYSDSMKEGGIVASRVRVQDAQRKAAEVCRAHNVALRLFHGRGGSVSRGGGPAHSAIRSLPRAAFSGHMKITEQGETRAFHFANPDLAVRYLEQSVGAALVVRHEARRGLSRRAEAAGTLLDKLAELSFTAYRELVADPRIMPYFLEATPYRSIAALSIASRPAKRGDATDLSDLRAIPWVFAWGASRVMMTGWYGAGTALEAVLDTTWGEAALRTLYQDDLFFRELIAGVKTTLAIADLGIAAHYASLCVEPAVRQAIYQKLEAEHARATRAVLRITGTSTLLPDDAVLARSIRLRNPYVDPLSYLQVEALRRARSQADDGAKEPFLTVSRGALQGIAAGLRGTG